MFSGKTKKDTFHESPSGSATTIGNGTVITGDVETPGDLRVDGTLNGNITVKGKLLIGPEGRVNGDINSQVADILGQVKGKCTIKDLLQLRGKGNIQGDIYAGKLQVEATATFNGHCHTGTPVVMLAAETEQVAMH